MKSYLLLWTEENSTAVWCSLKEDIFGIIDGLNERGFTPEDIDDFKCRVIADGTVLEYGGVMKLLKYDYPKPIKKEWMAK